MSNIARTALLGTIALLGSFGPSVARADLTVAGGFGPNGDLGFANSPPNLAITYGGDGQGSVYQMDGFVNVQGMSYGMNGASSAQLTNGSPAGIGYAFAATQPTADQLLLTYTFVNNTGSALPGFQFLYYVDPDDGADPNSPYYGAFLSEYATVKGLSSLGQGNSPTSFQVSDASNSDIFTTRGNGSLSNNNDFPNSNQVGDVAIGLGFSVGTLAVGQSAIFQVLLSDDGTSLGNFSITQQDQALPSDSLTISGAVVPEPHSLILLAVGSILGLGHRAWRRTCC